MDYFKLSLFLIVLMVTSSSGVYAINTGEHRDNMVKVNAVNGGDFKTIYVAKNGTDRNDGLTPEKPKRNIQPAVNAALPGDTIKIGPGVYADVPIDVNKNITLSGTSQETTIIDGQNQPVTCVHIESGVNATITDITIKNSDITKAHLYCGGGIINDGVLNLKKSTVANNKAQYGGGIYNLGMMTLTDVIVKNNIANGFAGGIDNYGEGSVMVISNSIITNNSATYGGGIHNRCNLTIINTNINNNKADKGAGIDSTDTLIIEDSIITNNAASGEGGGIRNRYYAYIFGSTITNNKATDGGGIFNSFKAYVDDFTIIGNNTPNNIGGNPIIPA